jgi:hypothetical protein
MGRNLPSFLLTKKKGLATGDLDRSNVSFAKVVFDVFLQGVHFCRGEVVDATFLYSSLGLEVDSMVPWLMLGQAFRCLFAKNTVILMKLCGDVF